MRGRQIRVPRVAVRPTQDRVREALFSALQAIIPDARVLDLFAGSGALGIESLSRGAAHVTWVEEDRRVFSILRSNVETICGPVTDAPARRCVCADVFSFMRKRIAEEEFDVIFADPPYQKGEQKVAVAAVDRLLTAVAASGLLAPGGIFALEQDAGEPEPESAAWELIRDKRYGGSRLRFFKSKGDKA